MSSFAGETRALAAIKQRIAHSGPINIAEFMRIALAADEGGYYRTRDPLGAAGDFTTAPEISQMFGELIGLWCVDTWQRLGAPDPCLLVELGPGRGTLMADALRAARLKPEFLKAVRLHLVDINPEMIESQRQALEQYHPTWHADVTALPSGPMILVANEFLDALPIHQFQMTKDGWRERAIALTAGKLRWVTIMPGPQLALLQPAHLAATEGAIAEVNPSALSLAGMIGARLKSEIGAALFIDYGPAKSGLGDSFQALHRHRYCDPLDHIGEADLTAHVDFEAFARLAGEAGARCFGPVEQGSFLRALGIELRAAKLSAHAEPETAEQIRLALDRLIGPKQMGSLFKALAVTGSQVSELAGFA